MKPAEGPDTEMVGDFDGIGVFVMKLGLFNEDTVLKVEGEK